MSIDALVFTRTKPELDMDEMDVEDIEFVQITAPRPVEPRDWRVIGREPAPSMGWVTDVNCSNSAYDALEAFSTTLARRSGGGIFWCDLTGTSIEVPKAAGPARLSLLEELEAVQLGEIDDEDD